MPALEVHKQHLKDLRDSLKPMDRHELFAFEKEYIEKRKLFKDQKERERLENYNKLGIVPPKGEIIKSTAKWQEISERDQEEKKMKEMKDQEVIQLTNRRKEYANLIKKTHWPEVSKKKQKELMERRLKLDSKSTRSSAKPLTQNKNNSVIGGSVVCPNLLML